MGCSELLGRVARFFNIERPALHKLKQRAGETDRGLARVAGESS